MSYYYKYDFVSPAPLYAKVREELKSYFDSGAVDDLLFPTWTNDCIRKLGKVSYQVKSTLLHITDYQERLPDDFHKVKEAWACIPGKSVVYEHPSYIYQECITSADLVGSNIPDTCDTCNDYPSTIKVVYKFKDSEVIHYHGRSHLLKPGNLPTKECCVPHCENFYSTSSDIFDIHGNKFTTNFREGHVYLVYHAHERDSEGNRLIIEDIQVQNYIEAYLKFKLFEQLSNTVTDETFKQIAFKLERAERAKDEAWVIADTWTKKETVERKQLAKKRALNQNRMYDIR